MHCSVLALTCGASTGITKNISRRGLLIHVISNGVLPGVGEPVTVDVNLPATRVIGRKCLRCRGTVLRVIEDGSASLGVAIEVDHMVFRDVRFGMDETVAGGIFRIN